jgi:hypothetical protein
MNSSLFARANAVIPVTGVDFTGKEGYLMKNAAGAPALNDSATVPAVAVILDGGTDEQDTSVGILGATPPVRMKSSGAIGLFDEVAQAADGTVVTDPKAGTRVIVGTALEAAAAGDLFLVQPCKAQIRA